ncbi:MAG: sulfatase-like hydrolase/transferase [Candidatus Solibacter sp.]|nr:sulfatase-like hydrolase/transferase [Candidatus Solibacter sp.]
MNLSRRHFFLGSLALPAFAAEKPLGEQPNVLLILVEGLPTWILGCYGNREVRTPNIDRREVRTPNIDRLVQTGTRFLNHYACAPVADKARAALLSGRTNMQLKDTGEITLEKLLGGIGYVWGTSLGGAEAAKFLDAQSAAKPFFLMAGFAPYASLPDAGPYAEAKLDTFAQEAMAKNAARGKEMLGPNLLANLRRVAAATTALDVEIGALVTKVTQKKLLDHTLIVFTSPCGSLFGRHGLWASGDGSDPVNMYEEAIGTPMVWSWPGHVVPLATRPEMVSAYDLVPTVCDITPAKLPDRNLCGRSYLAVASGKPLPKKQPWRTTVFAQYGDTAMARSDRYKLVVRNDGKGPGELYDDKVDAREKVNQYDNPQFMTVKASLLAELGKWKQNYSA